ncbi:MAG: hypothetical protein HGB19_06355 [Chlorobiales bacterium]|jgi:3',5'-cyclic-AMP phosphodiesterase|nr:hypothetical protein [Chlorobiales bacterium]
MKLAHITDLHINSADNPERLEQLEFLVKNIFDDGYDHLIVTGDLVDVANEDDMRLIRQLFERLGVFDWQKLTVIPGNHDIFGKYELNAERVFVNAMNAAGNKSIEKLRVFSEIFRDVMTPNDQAHYYFPFIKVIDGPGGGIAIIAFNSVLELSLTENPIGSRGYIRREELNAVENPLVMDFLKDKFVITISHHGYRVFEPENPAEQAFVWSMELINNQEYLQTMKRINTRIALHGHFHRADSYHVDGIHIVNGGAFKRARRTFNSIFINDDGSYEQQFFKYQNAGAASQEEQNEATKLF